MRLRIYVSEGPNTQKDLHLQGQGLGCSMQMLVVLLGLLFCWLLGYKVLYVFSDLFLSLFSPVKSCLLFLAAFFFPEHKAFQQCVYGILAKKDKNTGGHMSP